MSCSRSSGSRMMNAESLSSSVGLLCGSICGWCRVRIGIAESLQYARFQLFHRFRFTRVFVLVTLQVQDAVHREVGVVRDHVLALLARFLRDDGRAQGEIALIGRIAVH